MTEKTKGGVVTEYKYTPRTGETTTYGNPTRVIIRNSDYTVKCGCDYEYSEDYNYLTKVTDSRSGVTSYSYDNAGRRQHRGDNTGDGSMCLVFSSLPLNARHCKKDRGRFLVLTKEK